MATLLAVKEELIVPWRKKNSTVVQQGLQIYLECEGGKGTLLDVMTISLLHLWPEQFNGAFWQESSVVQRCPPS